MGASPERPCDDVAGSMRSSCETLRYASDFLDRPADEARCLGLASSLVFLGTTVGLMPDRGHHGEGEHDERDVTMPAMPGSRLVVVEPELVLGGLEAVLDRPAMAFDADQRLDRSPCRDTRW